MAEKIIIRAKGARGPKGDAGGINILGSYPSLLDLQTAHPTGNTNDAYLIGADLYVWSVTENNWINAGPVSTPGPQGPVGPQGLKGDTGAAGPKGDTGAQGQTGPQGPKGDTGASGPKGDTGAQGQTGPQGPKGDTGAAGPKGDTGAQGPAGTNAEFNVNLVSYKHEQQTPSGTWNITHNLGFYPNIKVMDYTSVNVECEIEYLNINQVRLTFIQAGISILTSGFAYLS
jgi:hypothetical protein